MPPKYPNVGDVVEVALPNGTFAYGRVLRDGCVAFYRTRSSQAGKPPIGSRDFQFVVGVDYDVLTSGKWPVVATDPNSDPEEDWPPAGSVTDVITKRLKYIYERGQLRPPKPGEDGVGLEPVASWGSQQLVDRLMKATKAN